MANDPFKWRHYQSDIILLCVRWYLRYSLSYRDLEEMMTERSLSLDHTTYIGAVRDLMQEKLFPEKCKRRPSQYMNNIIEQDHRFIKRKVKPGLGFFSYPTAWRTIQGYETMHMIRKGQNLQQVNSSR